MTIWRIMHLISSIDWTSSYCFGWDDPLYELSLEFTLKHIYFSIKIQYMFNLINLMGVITAVDFVCWDHGSDYCSWFGHEKRVARTLAGMWFLPSGSSFWQSQCCPLELKKQMINFFFFWLEIIHFRLVIFLKKVILVNISWLLLLLFWVIFVSEILCFFFFLFSFFKGGSHYE